MSDVFWDVLAEALEYLCGADWWDLKGGSWGG